MQSHNLLRQLIVSGQCANTEALIVRLVERQNKRTSATLTFAEDVTSVHTCNLMESPDAELAVARNRVQITINPYESMTLAIQ